MAENNNNDNNNNNHHDNYNNNNYFTSNIPTLQIMHLQGLYKLLCRKL